MFKNVLNISTQMVNYLATQQLWNWEHDYKDLKLSRSNLFFSYIYSFLYLVFFDSNQSMSPWSYSKSLILHLGYLSLVM